MWLIRTAGVVSIAGFGMMLGGFASGQNIVGFAGLVLVVGALVTAL